MDEREISRLMKYDFSIGSEVFRDSLLARCLSVLNDGGDVLEISDADLDLLAAAGDPNLIAAAGEANPLADDGEPIRVVSPCPES